MTGRRGYPAAAAYQVEIVILICQAGGCAKSCVVYNHHDARLLLGKLDMLTEANEHSEILFKSFDAYVE